MTLYEVYIEESRPAHKVRACERGCNVQYVRILAYVDVQCFSVLCLCTSLLPSLTVPYVAEFRGSQFS